MDNFEKQIHSMFDHIWDCNIDHPVFEDTVGDLMEAVIQCYQNLTSAQPNLQPTCNQLATDCISRQAAINACHNWDDGKNYYAYGDTVEERLQKLPAARPEPLTDKEQRIFLAAMAREEKICEEVDRNYVREPYEDSLMGVCKEIRRKVKDALWT